MTTLAVLRSPRVMNEAKVGGTRVVYLARHGETEWNRVGRWQGHTDIPLTDHGRAQAALLAERMRAEQVCHVVASDLSRAHETALIVARALGIEGVLIDADLRERMFGSFEGLTRTQCETDRAAEWVTYRADPKVGPPGAESHDAVSARMQRAVLRAAALPGEGAVLVVTHGGAMRILGNAIADVGTEPIQNGDVFRVEVAGESLRAVVRIRSAE